MMEADGIKLRDTQTSGILFHFASAFVAFHSSWLTTSVSAEWSLCRLQSKSIVSGHSFTMWDIIWTIPYSRLLEDSQVPLDCLGSIQALASVEAIQHTPHPLRKVVTRLSVCMFHHKWLIDHCSQLPSFEPCLIYIKWYTLGTDWVKVSRPTQHKIGHFGDVLPSQSLGLVLKNQTKHNTSKHASVTNYTTT